jgi:signal transduction histidine kinase/CheY-like chemotaxis protein
VEYRIVRPDGEVRHIRDMAMRYEGPDGSRMVGLVWDITADVERQAELNLRRLEAEAATVAKSRFLAAMSHEIRTPMGGVLGLLGLLLEGPLEPEQRQRATVALASAQGLLGILNDILDFSKLEANQIRVSEEEVDPRQLVGEVMALMAAGAEQKGLALTHEVAAAVPERIVTDPMRLRQVLTNLVSNATKFTDVGHVSVRVDYDAEADRLLVEVEDTGIGISEDAKQRLFMEFTQVEASITRRYGGTGLGLAICKKIVSAMDGTIGVESREGKGSTFWFELPFNAPDSAPAPILTQVPEGLTAALIAEDDLGRAAVAGLLRELGLNVVASDQPDDFGEAHVVVVHIHHPLAIDLIGGKTPAGAADLPFIGYGSGSISMSGGALRSIDGPVTPSSMVHALAGPSLAGEQAPPPKMLPTPPKRSSTRLAVLLAEDNAVNQRIASTMLRNMGHSVDIAGNGRDALAKAQIRIYDVIVMDMQMPGMDGLEATRAIRELPGPAGAVPIIAMTANAFAADRNACLEAGMNDFISKPITAHKLFDAIEPWASGINVMRETDADVMADESAPPLSPEPAPLPPLELDPEIIDVQQMSMIRDELGDEGLHELLISFWTDAAGLLSELEQTLTAGDHKRASEVLHTLKGSASNLGLIGCGNACDAARVTIAEGGTPDFNALLLVLSKTLQTMQPPAAPSAQRAAAA